MDETRISRLATWVTDAGLAGQPETVLVGGFCKRAVEGGLPLARAQVFIDTLHPVHEGRLVQWQRDNAKMAPRDYGRTDAGDGLARWQRSPFYHLLETGESVLRCRLVLEGAADREFDIFPDLRASGCTDYLAIINRFAPNAALGNMDCVYSSWISDQPGGFSDADCAALQRLVPFLALAVKSAALSRIAETLAETYLGRDAGHRVLSGRIMRGVADQIDTVLWFSDLRGFTRITDTTPEHVIPLLNDYADAIISAIHDNGGDVLKLIGDGTLAIFTAQDRAHACASALAAAVDARNAVTALNERRAAAEAPVTEMYLGLHVGKVFYGNIGSQDRLDFTVVGPTVNEVSRIAALCRSVEQPLLLSAAFVEAFADTTQFASVGRYALRGVGRPQELFTLMSDLAAS